MAGYVKISAKGQITLVAEGLFCSSRGQVLSALAFYTKMNIDWNDVFIAESLTRH